MAHYPYPDGEQVEVFDGSPLAQQRYGDPDPVLPVKAAYPWCRVAPGDARNSESTFQRDTVEIAFTVFLPPDADITATDRVRLRSKVWNVSGNPDRWRTGVVVALTGATG